MPQLFYVLDFFLLQAVRVIVIPYVDSFPYIQFSNEL